MIKTREELINEYISFFKSKNHKQIPNSSLIPENDPTTLFISAGMHPLVPFLLGEKHPQGKRLVNIQKCIRTGDIDEVGDNVHLTFFEMLGNWSLGDYWKKQAIEYSYEFLTKILKLDKNKLSISCFAGDENAPKDQESSEIWRNLGINKIKFLSREENWWGPAGLTGPCGPDTEMFYNNTEIWNDVFMQYNKTKLGKYESLSQKNVDTGMGVERTLSILTEKDLFEIPCFLPLIEKIEKLSRRKYQDNKKAMRIIADHIKAAVMILNEKVTPSNTERGYVLRRLIRQAIRYGKSIMMQNNFTQDLARIVFEIYPDYNFNKEFILKELESEETRFRESLASGLKFFENIAQASKKIISGKNAFLLYQSYGFPIEITQELAKERNLEVDMIGFEIENKKHQALSKTTSSGVFKSGLADNSEQTTKYHTANHLLHAALKQVLSQDVEQRGSNITAERLRFDFSFDRKLTDKELLEIEKIVNENIKLNLDVKREELSLQEAKKSGALGIFDEKYKDKVSVYTICNPKKIISRDICAGPHVTNTSKLGKFKIIKEESSSKGVRRIKAELLDEPK